MSTIVWVPDSNTGSFMNPLNNQLTYPLHLPCWDGNPTSAQTVQQYLNSGVSGTNQWPNPTIDVTHGTLNFSAFSGNTDGQAWTIPSFSFPLGAVISAAWQTTPGDTINVFTRRVLEMNGTIRNEY